jgi:hypothetical protein
MKFAKRHHPLRFQRKVRDSIGIKTVRDYSALFFAPADRRLFVVTSIAGFSKSEVLRLGSFTRGTVGFVPLVKIPGFSIRISYRMRQTPGPVSNAHKAAK